MARPGNSSAVGGAGLPAPTLEFGALCEPLTIQLERQGWTVSDHTELMRVETIAHAVATVTIHGLMPRSQSDRARQKLATRVGKILVRAHTSDAKATGADQ